MGNLVLMNRLYLKKRQPNIICRLFASFMSHEINTPDNRKRTISHTRMFRSLSTVTYVF